MEFYGFSIWHDLLIGSQPWLDSLAIGTGDDFDPTGDGFTKVFSALRRVLDDSGLRGKLGGCLHTSSSFPAIMERFDLLPAFIAARDIFAKEIPLEVGMHCSFDPGDLPLAGRYPEVLRRDFDLATKLGAVTIVAHFPKKAGDTTPALLTELLSEPVIQTFRQFPKLTLCWENQGPKEFFGSLKHMLVFREQLTKTLRLAGADDLIDRHLFCLDTGHLLYWASQDPRGAEDAFQEINTILPKFARSVKVFHIHANDGAGDNHLVPHSVEFFNHKSRSWSPMERTWHFSARNPKSRISCVRCHRETKLRRGKWRNYEIHPRMRL
jgi:sugar phosphate isomerase/epimerase